MFIHLVKMRIFTSPLENHTGSPNSESPTTEALESLILKLVEALVSSENVATIHPLTGGGKCRASPFTSPARLRYLSHTVYLLSTVYRLHVVERRQVNQRELFYRSLSDPFAPAFGDQAAMNRAMFALMSALDCDRHQLGVLTTSRGLVAADMEVDSICLDTQGDCLCNIGDHADGLAISEQLVGTATLQTSAEFILVVEKDTVFQSLIRTDKFFKVNPCIVVTARGYPDNITLRFLKRLVQVTANDLPVLYLGDLDPHGVSIALVYHKALSGFLQWIGVHTGDIAELPFQSLVGIKMKASDIALLNGLIERASTPEYMKRELAKLETKGLKYEVESLHSMGDCYLALDWLPRKISRSLEQIINTD